MKNYIENIYPSWLPENEKIVKIRYLIEGENERYVLQSNNPIHSISIEVNADLSEDYITNMILKSKNVKSKLY